MQLLRKYAIRAGILAMFAGTFVFVFSLFSPVPARDSMPFVTGPIRQMWTVTQRDLIQTRIEIARPGGGAQQVWIPSWLIAPERLVRHIGREATIGYAGNGFVFDLVVEGERLLDYATVARQRESVGPFVRWGGLGMIALGALMASAGALFLR